MQNRKNIFQFLLFLKNVTLHSEDSLFITFILLRFVSPHITTPTLQAIIAILGRADNNNILISQILLLLKILVHGRNEPEGIHIVALKH